MSTVKANLIKDSGIHEDHSGYTVSPNPTNSFPVLSDILSWSMHRSFFP